MASTGEPLTVNSDSSTFVTNKFNQICGIKKGLESVIADTRKSYEDKFGSLVSSWDCLSNYASSKQLCPAHQSNITSLIKWIYPITIKIVIHTSWQKLKHISKVTISHALRRCKALLKAQEDIQVLENLELLIKGPWSDPIIMKLFDKSKVNIDHVPDSDVLAFCNSQGAMTLALRLEALSNSYCDNLCGNLSEACMRGLAMSGCNLGELGVDGDKRYIHYIIDIRVAVLYRRKQLKKLLGQFNNIGIAEVQKLVYRFQKRIASVSTEKPNLWSCCNDVVTVAIQHCVTKSMVAPVNDVEEAISVITLWVEQHAHLRDGFKSVAENVYKSAASSRHVFLFADIVKQKFGSKYPQLYIEYYLRGITMSLNELEYLKSFKVTNPTLIREMEVRMSDGFITLASLAKANDVVYRECFLTAFSLNPTEECLKELKRIGERRHQSDPSVGVCRPHVCVPPADGVVSRVISNGNDSALPANNNKSNTVATAIVDGGVSGDSESGVDVDRPKNSVEGKNRSEGVKAGVLCSRCGTFLPEEASESNSSWCQVSVDNEGLGLSPQQLDDLLVVLSSPRWRLLSWTVRWPELEKACELYLQNAPLRNTEKELTFLNKNIDYDQFDCWKYPKVCEEEFPGIEKGYENCLLADEEEEEIEEPPRKTKPVKKQSGFVDSDSSVDRGKKARRKWKKTDDVDYQVRTRAKPRVTKKRNLFLSSVSEYETTTQDSVRTEGNSDTYSLSPVEIDRSPSTRKMDIVLDCPPLKLQPIAFGFDENGEKYANIGDSKRLSDPKTLKQLRLFRNPAKKQTPEKKDGESYHNYAPMLSTLDLNPRVFLDKTDDLSSVKKLPATHPSKNGSRASLENCLPRLDRISAGASPASAKPRTVMGLDFLSSVLHAKERGLEDELDDRQLMKAHIPGLATLDMMVPLPAETSVHIVQLPQSVASTGSGQGSGQSVPPPKPAAQSSTSPAVPATRPPSTVAQSREARERVTITSILQSQPGLSFANRSGQMAPIPKASNETVTSEVAKPSEETVATPGEPASSVADANESLPKFHQAFTKTSRVLYCQPGSAVATTSQENATPSEDVAPAVSSNPGIAAVKEGLAAQAQVNPTGQVRQPLHVHVTPIKPPGHVVQVGTSQIRPPGQIVQIGSSGQLRQPSVVQLGSASLMKQAGQIVQVSPAGQIGRSIQMTQVIQAPQTSASPVGQISTVGLIGQASQVIAQASQPGLSTASIGNLNLVMSMPPILRVVQNPSVYINQISATAKTSFITASGDANSPAMSIILSKESRPGFVSRSTAAPPESESDDDASLPKPPNFPQTTSEEIGTSAGDLSPRSTSTYEQLQEFESVLKQVKEKGEIQGDVTSPIASTSVVHAIQAGSIGTIPCVKVPMSRIQTAANVVANVSALKAVAGKSTKLLMVTTNCPSLTAPATPTVASPGKTPPKSGKTSKPKSAKTSPTTATAAATAAKAAPIAKPQQKPQEDEQTAQRIYNILNQYAEQLRNSPDLNNKPAPRRRSNPPTNPGPSKRKKSTAKAKSTTAEMSPGVDDPAADEDDSSSTTLIHMGTVHDSPGPSQQSADEGQSQSVGASLEASSEGGNLKSVVMDANELSKEKVVDAEANASPAGAKPPLVANSSGPSRFFMNSSIRALLMQSFMKCQGKVIHVRNGPGKVPNMQIVVRHTTPVKGQGLAALCGGGGTHQRLEQDSITFGIAPLRSSVSTATVSAITTTPLPSDSPREAVPAAGRDRFQCGDMENILEEIPQMFVDSVTVPTAPTAVIGSPTAKEEVVGASAAAKIVLLEEAVPDRVAVEIDSEVGTSTGFGNGQQVAAGAVLVDSQAEMELDSASTELSEAQKLFECAEKDSENEEDVDREEIQEDDNTESEILSSKTVCSAAPSGAAVSKPAPADSESTSYLAGIIGTQPEGSTELAAGGLGKLTSIGDDFRETKVEPTRQILSKNPTGVVRKYKGKRPVAEGTANTFARKVVTASRANSRPYNAQPLLKSLSEECEDLGVDRPSTNDLFPETLLMMDADTSSSPGFEMAAVVPCPIDLNKHVPMFSGVEVLRIEENIEIASNVEVESNVEIDSIVEMDATMEIASNVEIGSNVDHSWNGSNDDSQLPRSRTSSTSSTSSSSSSSSSSTSSSSSSGGKQLPASEIDDDEFTAVIDTTDNSAALESGASAPEISDACASPALKVSEVSLHTGSGANDCRPVGEAVQHVIPKESGSGDLHTVPVVLTSSSEKTAMLGTTADQIVSGNHSQAETKSWPVVEASTADGISVTAESISDHQAGGAKLTTVQSVLPLKSPALSTCQMVVAKVFKANRSAPVNFSETLLQKSAKGYKKKVVEDLRTAVVRRTLSISSTKKRLSSQGQRRSSVIVSPGVAEMDSDIDSSLPTPASYSAHYETAIDTTAIGEDGEIVESTLVEEPISDNCSSQVMLLAVEGNRPVITEVEETSEVQESDEEEEGGVNDMEKTAVQAEAVEDTHAQTSSDAECPLTTQKVVLLNENDPPSCEEPSDCSEIIPGHEQLNTVNAISVTVEKQTSVQAAQFSPAQGNKIVEAENNIKGPSTDSTTESVPGIVNERHFSSPERDIASLQAGSISPASGQFHYDAEDSNGVDLSSVSLPGEPEQLSEQDGSEGDPHSPSSNTNDETKSLPPRYKVAPVERINTRSLSRGYSRSQSSQDGSASVEQLGETTEPPKKRLVKRGKPVWSDLFPSRNSRNVQKKKKRSAAASTDDATTSDDEVTCRLGLSAIQEEPSTKLSTFSEDPELELPVTVSHPSKQIPPELSGKKVVKRGRKPRVAASVSISDSLALVEEPATESLITTKPKPKRVPVNWTCKDEAIIIAKEQENDATVLPTKRQKRHKHEVFSSGKEKIDNINGGPSSACDDTVSLIIEAVVAACGQEGTVPHSSDDSSPSFLGSDSQESGVGGSMHTSGAECNPSRSNSSANGLPQPSAPLVPKRRGRKKKVREASETECSDQSGRKKLKADCEHNLGAAAGTSSSRVKRSQRSHKVKGCDCCNGASTKKKGARPIAYVDHNERKVEKKIDKDVSKAEKSSKPPKECNLEKDSTTRVEKSSNVERRESAQLEKEEPEKCPGNFEKGKKTGPAPSKIPVRVNNRKR